MYSAIGSRVHFLASTQADDIAYGIVVSETASSVRVAVATGDVRTVRADRAWVATQADNVTAAMRATHGVA